MSANADTQKMTAQQWANLYGWESATGGARFWLVILALLLVGVALGVYAVPRGILPGTFDAHVGRRAHNGVAELEAELSALRESTAIERMLKTGVEEGLAQANADGGAELVIHEMSPAYFYTVRDTTSELCVNLLTFENEGDVQTVTVADEHPCP